MVTKHRGSQKNKHMHHFISHYVNICSKVTFTAWPWHYIHFIQFIHKVSHSTTIGGAMPFFGLFACVLDVWQGVLAWLREIQISTIPVRLTCLFICSESGLSRTKTINLIFFNVIFFLQFIVTWQVLYAMLCNSHNEGMDEWMNSMIKIIKCIHSFTVTFEKHF